MRGQRMTIYSMNHRERPPRASRSKAQSIQNVALDDQVSAFYSHALRTLQDDGLNVLVGGAFALRHYTGIERHTKDFDLFLGKDDVPRAIEILFKAGYRA